MCVLFLCSTFVVRDTFEDLRVSTSYVIWFKLPPSDRSRLVYRFPLASQNLFTFLLTTYTYSTTRICSVTWVFTKPGSSSVSSHPLLISSVFSPRRPFERLSSGTLHRRHGLTNLGFKREKTHNLRPTLN